jgi:hypothetical protein
MWFSYVRVLSGGVRRSVKYVSQDNPAGIYRRLKAFLCKGDARPSDLLPDHTYNAGGSSSQMKRNSRDGEETVSICDSSLDEGFGEADAGLVQVESLVLRTNLQRDAEVSTDT